MVRKETWSKDTNRWTETVWVYECSMEAKHLWQTHSKAFDMSKATLEVSPKFLSVDDQDSIKKAKKTACAMHRAESALAIK